MDMLTTKTALELGALIAAREVSVTEVTAAALEAAYADRHAAFVHIAEEYALTQAAARDRLLATGDITPGPLFGVPCPIKDLNHIAGLPYGAGSPVMAGTVSPVDDGTVTRLHAAGTVTIGKTATPEFGLPCYTEPEGRTPTSTPFDATRGAGGSSGGAAAAVAQGIVPIAHGSDGGGSIRIPAAACGLVGLKPSRGRISNGPHGIDGPALATQGALTRTVADAAAVLDVLTGAWPGDTHAAPTAPNLLAGLDHELPPLRIGVITQPLIAPDAPVHPGALRAVERATGIWADCGHEIVAAPVPDIVEQWQAFKALWSVLALSIPLTDAQEACVRPLTRWLRERGRTVAGVEYAEAIATQQRLTRRLAALWEPECDVVVMPTLAQPPAPHGTLRDDADPARDFQIQTDFTPWTSVFNITGRPAISLPGHTEMIDGVELPFGVMAAAGLFREDLLLGLGRQLEEAQ